MLFADRLEVWNPGTLPPSLTLAKLREPHGSVPGNPLLAEPMYLAQYIERMGTGTGDMIKRCQEAGLQEPEFSLTDGFVTIIRRNSGEVTGEVRPQLGSQLRSQLESQLESSSLQEEITGEVGRLPESQPESLENRVLRLLISIPLSRSALSRRLGQKGISGRLNQVINVMLTDRTIEYTIPEQPNSRKQQYRLTEKGLEILTKLQKEDTA